jgi:hypothetical protein
MKKRLNKYNRTLKVRVSRFVANERVQDTLMFVAMLVTLYYFIKASV